MKTILLKNMNNLCFYYKNQQMQRGVRCFYQQVALFQQHLDVVHDIKIQF